MKAPNHRRHTRRRRRIHPVKVHDAAFLAGTKRLYMTATPRFSRGTKTKAASGFASMDDEAVEDSAEAVERTHRLQGARAHRRQKYIAAHCSSSLPTSTATQPRRRDQNRPVVGTAYSPNELRKAAGGADFGGDTRPCNAPWSRDIKSSELAGSSPPSSTPATVPTIHLRCDVEHVDRNLELQRPGAQPPPAMAQGATTRQSMPHSGQRPLPFRRVDVPSPTRVRTHSTRAAPWLTSCNLSAARSCARAEGRNNTGTSSLPVGGTGGRSICCTRRQPPLPGGVASATRR